MNYWKLLKIKKDQRDYFLSLIIKYWKKEKNILIGH